uniref:Root cap protein 1 n=1 Tax=Oryza punctata TaxID=4537 RepID=A0A0E0JU50_ORYPU
MDRQLVGALAALVAVCAVAAVQAQPPSPKLPPNYHMINPGHMGKRDQQLSCADTTGNNKGCVAKCDKRCPNQCIVLCPSCKTFCMCDFYPGVSCGDPRFTGGDGNNFYFHGKKDQDFCIVSDADLHINAHFIGKRNPTMSRDFTWIQALGIRFADHRLYMGALKTAKWTSDVDRLELAFDGAPIDVPAELGARWESAAVPGLTVTRTAATNGVRVQLAGVFDIMANVDSRIHNYGVTEEDSLAHLDLGFKFYDLSDDVHGVLGQTYRSDYVNKLSVSASMPVMGGAPSYVVSDIFSTDCAVARFARRAGISMVTGRAN